MLLRTSLPLFTLSFLVPLTGLAIEAPGDPGWFPFAITGEAAEDSAATDFSYLLHAPAGEGGFVRVEDGHFYTGDERLRFWGVNFSFGANFPSHEAAEKIAARLAGLGVNAVRFHHHDNAMAPRGLWRPTANGGRELDPAQLDRQDYLLNELHARGIYANLNLHVSRTFTEQEGFIDKDLSREFRYDKFLLYFEPGMRARFKEFCREYLWHRNPYRDNLRRVDDPGIGLIEITNENRFSEAGMVTAELLPEAYRAELQRQWNDWLAQRYGTTEKMLAAWEPPADPHRGEVLISAEGFGETKLNRPWKLYVGVGKVEERPDQPGPQADLPALGLHIVKEAGNIARQEMQYGGLSLERAQGYTLSFWVRASQPRRFEVDISNAGPDNWRSLGYSERIEAGPQWRHIVRPFIATETNSGNVRLCFKFGNSGIDLEFAGVVLKRGGDLMGLAEGESLEARNIPLPIRGSDLAAVADGQRFMVDVEKDFITDMTRYLREDLGVKVPITCSQASYHGTAITAEVCQYVDMHGYWQHPKFPGKPWDRKNWLVGNVPMEQAPGADTLTRLATWRLLDRPFTVSEWLIPNPNDYSASTAPFAAVIAGLQDWDGLFFFNYHTTDDRWDVQGLYDFFSLTGQPAKLALIGVGANLFLRGDLIPLKGVVAGTLEERPSQERGLSYRIGIEPGLAKPEEVPLPQSDAYLASPDERVVWDAEQPERARVTVDTPATRGAFGLIAGSEITLAGVSFELGPVDRDYVCVFLSSLDGQPLEQSARMLLVAVSRAENPGMGWNADRNSVADRWGKGPAEVNGIPAQVTLDAPVSAVYALDGDGRRIGQVEVVSAGSGSTWQIGPEHRTLWYEVVR
ncbi:MAG: hypothetical protein Q7Q73_04515 [Verrucomicrobiota bacterium JB024]|nr:hypothetical protein [Verrucomicrobiota bacterium JB024]